MENTAQSLITTIPLSSSLNELFSALAKAQAIMHAAMKSSDNPFFKSKYADFAEIVSASRPALSANGLSVIQRIITLSDGSEALHSILGHASGQYIDSVMRIKPQKADVQSLGSYITYLKRYAYAALVGVVTEDDDGEAAVGRSHERGSNTINEINAHRVISHVQAESLNMALDGLPNEQWLRGRILEYNKVDSLENLPADKFGQALKFILDNAPKEA